jgi:short-subunit dehydrogenase
MSLNENSVVVITGAASGIGRALAQQFANEKIAGLALSDVNEAGLSETAQMLNAKFPVSTHLLDVSKLDQVQNFHAEVLAKHSCATHLINNAGVALVGNFDAISIEDMEWLMGINFWGTVYGTKIFLPTLRAQKFGHVINLSSVFGLIGPPGQAIYSASKFAVRGFTESLRNEFDGSNVLFTSVHPGGIKTNICNDSRVGTSASEKEKEQAVKFFNRASPTTAEEAAAVIIKGIKNREVRILIGKDAKRIDKIQRWFPKTYFAVMDRLSGGKLTTAMRKK